MLVNYPTIASITASSSIGCSSINIQLKTSCFDYIERTTDSLRKPAVEKRSTKGSEGTFGDKIAPYDAEYTVLEEFLDIIYQS